MFTHIPKQMRRKWDSKSKKGIFIEYQENTKGYKIYYPAERKVEIVRDVVFEPNVISKQDKTQDGDNRKGITINRTKDTGNEEETNSEEGAVSNEKREQIEIQED